MNRLDRAYLRVATRSLDAADAAGDNGVHEKAGFLAYHAYESAGGALCASKKVLYPAGHHQKIQQFVQTARHEKYGKSAAQLAVEVASIRNRMLYPRALPDGTFEVPESVISASAAIRLVGRIKVLVSRVSASIK